MYIYKIIIKNFRNIDFLEWNPDKKVNVLFGHNGCGKSNIAQALNLLFSTSRKGDYFEINDYYKKNEKNKILIQVWLNEIDDAEIEDKDRAIQYISEDDKIVNEDTDLQGCREMLIVQLTNDDDRRMLWSLVTNTEEIKFNLLARKSVNYNFVSTQRSPIKELSFGYQTLLQELIKEEIDGELKEISNDAIKLINTELEESQTIKKFLEESLKIDEEINGVDKYKIIAREFIGSKSYNNLELGITKENYNLPLESQSTGIQNLLLLSLMKKKLEGKGIVFIEELEQNLEPKNQIYILDQYKKLEVGQLFITSHSPDIIESFDYSNIYFMNDNKINQLFELIGKDILKEICKANKKSFIASVMSKRVVLVEGESEYNSIPVYVSKFGKYMDYSLIQVEGKGNFNKYIDALNKVNIKPFIITDNDNDLKISDVKTWASKCERVYISKNDYEDWIYPYINENLKKFEEYMDFNKVKGSICSTNDEKIKNEIEHKGKENINKYEDLKDMMDTIKYMLHRSFAGAYYARLLSNLMIEDDYIPEQFTLFIDNMLENRQLKIYDESLSNTFLLEEI